MKLVLNSNYEEARKVASCFVGQEISKHTSLLYVFDKRFHTWLLKTHDIFTDHEKLDIDLDLAQPCIYACMKYGLRVEVTWGLKNGRKFREDFNLSRKVDCEALFAEWSIKIIKSIKLLNLDQMEGIEVVG